MTVLVTGAAGFIGNALALELVKSGHEVIGIDNLNDYYQVQLKHDRLERLNDYDNFKFIQLAVEDRAAMQQLAEQYSFTLIYHMAAQAGVRYSIENPAAYIDSNLVGFGNILELARQQKVEHLVYASSSSVYGANKEQPFSEQHNVDHPVSLYAATKKSNEVMAHSYSHLYGIPTTGLRFFTVYGPWGRPDMAPFLFLDAILNDRPIKVFNHGDMERDFTYIDDIIEGVIKAGEHPPQSLSADLDRVSGPAKSDAPYQLFNIGNSKPVRLMEFIETIERESGKQAEKIYMDMQPGDVPSTYADTSMLEQRVGYKPSTELSQGLKETVAWYKSYYRK
ncbi:NAD-dependent epimerase [Reinekea thalattae]|uniref:NAD-dependent epimerase n=1 Tax=Reinekea thalattae TaxID=2593301 RepID=A0A5C8Z6T1_9GAMM|nr:NAD-dependent epimerase [Reinekea thalattae]TXR53337.1 NAD-dependent epimerase [Reinekea thalattae]